MGRPIDTTQKTIPDCLQVIISWLSGNTTFHNVLHGRYTGPQIVDATIATALFTAFKSALTSSAFASDLSTATTMTGVSIKDMRTPNQPTYLSTGIPAAGTGTGTAVSVATAIVVSLKTAKSGREWRGRAYLGGLDSIALANSHQHTAAAGTNAVAFLTALDAAMTTNGLPMCIAQRALLAGQSSSGAPLPARQAAVVDVTSWAITNPRLDTQRKRLGK